MPSISEALATAARYHQSGAPGKAHAIYAEILAAQPNQVEALHRLGVIAHESGQSDKAVDLIGRAVKLDPRRAEAQSDLALALAALDRLGEAVPHLRRALKLKPNFAEAHNNLGLVLWRQGKLAGATSEFRDAVRLKAGYAEALNNLAFTLAENNQLEEAAATCREALRLKPDVAEVQLNLGLILMRQGQPAAAEFHLERAAALRPELGEAQLHLGIAEQVLGKFEPAIAHLERALTLNPKLTDAHAPLGIALFVSGRKADALPHLRQAAILNPADVETSLRLVNALVLLGHGEEATSELERILERHPDDAKANCFLGLDRQNAGRAEEARTLHARALAAAPGLAESRLGFLMAQLPMIYDDVDTIARQRAAYEQQLHELDDYAAREGYRRLLDGVSVATTFYLAYQGLNDRELQRRYGELVCRIVADRTEPAALPPPPEPGEPIRVGFVGGQFRDHSVWKMPVKGWLTQLDRSRFELFGYHTGAQQDAETAIAAGLFRRFVQGPLSLQQWREAILADRPHVLIYPEIGMEGMVIPLAAQRLARVQCSSWGHPQTSGFPTIDFFLSSALMEPPDGDDYYTERLVRLPNLSVYYEPPPERPSSLVRADFGLRADTTVYWSAQSVYKYLPQYDAVFPRIARAVGNCQFAFIAMSRFAAANARFRQRLGRAFEAHGLKADDFCVFLPALAPDRFAAAQGLADVFLDTIGWSGCNSAMESLVHNLPIVTFPGAPMRARHSMAILQRMGIAETIAGSIDEYVEIAIRLAREPLWRRAMTERVRDNKRLVYADHSVAAALEAFLEQAVRG